MLKKEGPVQSELKMVSLEFLVSATHLLCKIDRHIDFSFIHDRVAHLYCADNGRPALDRTVLFKILVTGYLFDIRSERQLMHEIEVNVAYLWFLEMRLTDKGPDTSILSQNRRRRFTGASVCQDIFDEIVLQAIKAGLVDSHTLYTDSTHLKANANKQKLDQEVTGKSRTDYLDELGEAIDTDRAAHGKKPLKNKDREIITKKTKVSRTDKDAGYIWYARASQKVRLSRPPHVDGVHAIITDSHVTAGNVHDSIP